MLAVQRAARLVGYLDNVLVGWMAYYLGIAMAVRKGSMKVRQLDE